MRKNLEHVFNCGFWVPAPGVSDSVHRKNLGFSVCCWLTRDVLCELYFLQLRLEIGVLLVKEIFRLSQKCVSKTFRL